VEGAGLLGGEDVTLFGEADGWGHVLLEGELAEVLLGVGEAGDGAGDADGFVAEGGEAGDHIALGVEIHGGGGGLGSALAEVEEVGCAGVVAEEHEASAAEIAGLRQDDGEGEADRDGGVDGVASLLEDLEARVGGAVMDGDHHGVLRGRGLREGGRIQGQRDSERKNQGSGEGAHGGLSLAGMSGQDTGCGMEKKCEGTPLPPTYRAKYSK
jgi:hypothetical protein